jgi:hypothetical protein
MLARWIGRGALVLTLAVVTSGAAGLAAGPALALTGSQPGDLMLSPATGSTLLSATSTPPLTWSTSTPCPAGFQGSAAVEEVSDGTPNGVISGTVTNVAAPFSGVFLSGTDMALILQGTGLTLPFTVEFVVGCAAGANLTGATEYVQSTFVTDSADGTRYTTSATYPAQATAVTVTTIPVAATAGASVNVTATEVAADGTHPAGFVQFEVGGTNIGGPVFTHLDGTAGAIVTAGAPGTEEITAVFTPTPVAGLPAFYAGSTGMYSLLVEAPGTPIAGTVAVSTTVPPTGALTVTVAPGVVKLALIGLTGTGLLPDVTIADTRNSYPGWSVSGQESNFTSSATPSTPISGTQLGWAPAAASGSNTFDGTHVALGPMVAPGGLGLGLAAGVLALAHAGYGADPSGATSWIATADLTLDIPVTATAGDYTGDLTLTYLSAQS